MFHVIDTTIVDSYIIMYKHYYKMWVQFTSPCFARQVNSLLPH
jgi:hypothetical protein